MTPDPWGVLGVPATASLAEARQAYAAEARRRHPDRHPGAGPEALAEAQRAMSELNQAWDAIQELLGGPAGPAPAVGGAAGSSGAGSDRSGGGAGRGGEVRVLLRRDLESATTALDLVRATRQLRAAAVQALLARFERSRWTQLTGQLEEMLRHAEARRTAARRAVTDAESRRDRFGGRRRLLRHHRLALQVHEAAVVCHQRLLLGEPVDAALAEMGDLVAELAAVPDA